MKESELSHAPGTRSPNEIYGYPAADLVFSMRNASGEVHIIWGATADPTADHANAPNGSIYIPLVAVGGTSKVWVKYATAFGGKDGTWAATAALA